MSALNARLFGPLVIERPGGAAVDLPSPRVQELFCYLVLHRRPHPREGLIDQFWRHSAPAQARRNLRQTLWQLQRALAQALERQQPALICASPALVQIHPQATITTDVAAFEAAFAPVDGVAGEELDAAQAQGLQDALALYRGDLLEGWYQEWCLVERERLRTIYLAMLDKLMSFCAVRQAFDLGLGYGERALRCERSSERVHRHMMRLHYLAGDRAAALGQYDRCAAILQEELGVTPSAHTDDLCRQIRASAPLQGEGRPPAERASRPAVGAPVPPALLDVHSRLLRLTGAVASLQAQLQQELRHVEHVIEELRG